MARKQYGKKRRHGWMSSPRAILRAALPPVGRPIRRVFPDWTFTRSTRRKGSGRRKA